MMDFDPSEIGENQANAERRGRALCSDNAKASGLGPERIVEAQILCQAIADLLMKLAPHVVNTDDPTERARILKLATQNMHVICEGMLEATLADEREGKTEQTRARVMELLRRAQEQAQAAPVSANLLGLTKAQGDDLPN
jgi:hypothetical protein